MSPKLKAFMSHNHTDHEIALKLATDLIDNGVDVWLDKWEIRIGDSLIKKIFEEGLANCDAFIILLSKASVASSWVQHELDVAMVNKIEGLTKIMPVVVENCTIPVSLRALRWLDITNNYENGLRELIKTIFEVKEKPAIGSPPNFVRSTVQSVSGLSKEATQVGLLMILEQNESMGVEKMYPAPDIAKALNLTPQETDDAIDELEETGLVKTRNYIGTAPFQHGYVEPRYVLFIQFQNSGVKYDPYDDLKKVSACIVAVEKADGKTITEKTSLSPLRVNRAIRYLLDNMLIETRGGIGTTPYIFSTAIATGATRRFVKEKCC
jgi:DNA-binding transcriptional regulator YhcF (GntR family)